MIIAETGTFHQLRGHPLPIQHNIAFLRSLFPQVQTVNILRPYG